jgi:hypothetical protein
VVVFTAFSFVLSSSNVSSAAPYTSASPSSSSPPTVESAHFSTRRATIVGRYGGTVVGEVYQFLDVNFSEPMYARIDNLLCPASADASTGLASPRCAAASSDGGASCGNFTSSSSCLDSSSHTCLVAGQGSAHAPTNPSCTHLFVTALILFPIIPFLMFMWICFIYLFCTFIFIIIIDLFICLFVCLFSSGAGERGGLHVEFFLDRDAVVQQRPRLRAPDQRRSRPLSQPDRRLPHLCRLHMVPATAKAHAPSLPMA